MSKNNMDCFGLITAANANSKVAAYASEADGISSVMANRIVPISGTVISCNLNVEFIL